MRSRRPANSDGQYGRMAKNGYENLCHQHHLYLLSQIHLTIVKYFYWNILKKHYLLLLLLTIFTNPSARAGYDSRSIFKRGLTGLNSVFLLPDYLPRQGWRTQSVLLFTHNWRENNWNHTFPKGSSTMWNAISLVQD